MIGDEKEDIALLFPKFFKQAPHWKIAVVSGTADAAVPFLGTERWMECLNQPVLDDWKLWYMNGDVAVRPSFNISHFFSGWKVISICLRIQLRLLGRRVR